MNPITLAILAGTAGQTLGQLPSLIPSSLERAQKKELEALKRRQELGTLGLTDKEQAAIIGRLSGGASQAEAYGESERMRALAGAGATGGKALEMAVLGDAARADRQEKIGQAVLEADLAREEAEKERIRALEAAAAEQRGQRLAAASSIAGAGLEAGLTTAAQQKIIQGARSPSPQMIASVKQAYGFGSDEEARGYIELVATDPAAANLMTELMVSKAKAGAR